MTENVEMEDISENDFNANSNPEMTEDVEMEDISENVFNEDKVAEQSTPAVLNKSTDNGPNYNGRQQDNGQTLILKPRVKKIRRIGFK